MLIDAYTYHAPLVPFLNAIDAARKPIVQCSDLLQALVEKVKQSTLGKWMQKYEPSQIVTHVYTVIHYVYNTLNSVLAYADRVAFRVSETVRAFLKEFKFVLGVVKFLQLAAIAITPYTLYQIIKQAIAFVKGNLEDKIDSALHIMSYLSSLLDGITAFSRGLTETASIVVSTLKWIPVANIISTVLSLANIVLHARGWWQTKTLINELSVNLSIDKISTDPVQAQLYVEKILNTDDKRLEKILNVTSSIFKKNLSEAKDLCEAASHIHKYIEAKSISHILKGVADVVNTVALIVIFSGVLMPLALGLIAVSSTLHLSAYIQEKYHFNKVTKLVFTPNTGQGQTGLT